MSDANKCILYCSMSLDGVGGKQESTSYDGRLEGNYRYLFLIADSSDFISPVRLSLALMTGSVFRFILANEEKS